MTVTASTQIIPLAYRSAGWSYLQVGYGEQPGFEAPGFDATSWPLGQAGFGTTDGTCSWNDPDRVHTAWQPETEMLIRHAFTLPADATSVHISGTVDNDADVYVNGTLVQHVSNGFCQANGIDVDVPAGVVGTNNLIAVRAHDTGSADFIDVQVTYAH